MSIDAGGLAQMTYNNTNNGFSSSGLGLPGSGFGGRSRINPKRLSVALPPKVNPISEDSVDNPTPRTSRSHLLAGLRTQPKTPAVPASAPSHQTEHHLPGHNGLGASKWANAPAYSSYEQSVPQTATGVSFDRSSQYAVNAGRQMYALPEQVLAPPSLYDQAEEMDPAVLQQMQMTSIYLAQRQQQLQLQLASLTASAQGLSLNGNFAQQRGGVFPPTPQAHQNLYLQQQMQSPVEVSPGVYAVYNPAMQGYSYYVDPTAQQQQHLQSPAYQTQQPVHTGFEPPMPSVSVSPPISAGRPTPPSTRSFTPPKKTSSPPATLDHVEPLPPPSSTAFRRGHSVKKSASLSISTGTDLSSGPKTASFATSQLRASIPAGPFTGTNPTFFGPGAARAGEHPLRQPRGPPPLEELAALPTARHEGSKNFATRQRRRALDELVKAGSNRRVESRGSGTSSPSSSPGGSDVDFAFEGPGRKISPIGFERGYKGEASKRSEHGSEGEEGYFGPVAGLMCSSASSSETDEGCLRLPLTPATPGGSGLMVGEGRKMALAGVLGRAEKRRSVVV